MDEIRKNYLQSMLTNHAILKSKLFVLQQYIFNNGIKWTKGGMVRYNLGKR